MESFVKLFSEAAPSAFLAMMVAITVAYLGAKVKFSEFGKVRELEEKKIRELIAEVENLRSELKDKQSKIEVLHQQIIDIAIAKSVKGDL